MLKKIRKLFQYPYIFIIAAPFILYAPIFLSGDTVFWGTQVTQFVPWWTQAVQSLQAGELPLWNPNNGMGAPLLANYQSALLYPPTWFILGLGLLFGNAAIAWGLAPLLMLHLIWAGLGMALLIRQFGWGQRAQLVAGLAFSMSGYLVARAHFPSIIFALAWLPSVLYATRALVYSKQPSRNAIKLSIIVAMQLLAGHAQSVWYTLLIASVWFVYWSWQEGETQHVLNIGKYFILSMLAAASLSAVQLLPTVEYLLQSQRSSAVDFDFAMVNSFWPWRLLTLLAPNLFGSPAAGDYWGYATYWEDAIYVGLIPVILAILAVLKRGKSDQDKRLVRFLGLIIAVSFLFALGDNTDVYPWLYYSMPTFDMFQAPTRYNIWAIFSIAILAGMGAHYWRRPSGRGLYWSRLGAMGAFAISVGAGFGWWLLAQENISLGEIKPTFVPAIALMGVWALFGATLNLTMPLKDNGRGALTWKWVLGVVICLDLLVVSWGLNPAIGIDLFAESDRAAIMIAPETKGSRIYISVDNERRLKFDRFFSFETFRLDEDWTNLRTSLLPNANLLSGISSANNFDPLVPGRYDTWMEALEVATPNKQAEMLRMMDVALIESVSHSEPFTERIDELTGARRWRWVECWLYVEDAPAALDLVTSESVNIENSVILETQLAQNNNCDTNSPADLEIVAEEANYLAVQVATTQEGWLVLSDVWYPGWQATIDGVPIEIVHANYLFRAIHLGAGSHLVEYRYQPISFYAGLFISLISLLVLTVVWRKEIE